MNTKRIAGIVLISSILLWRPMANAQSAYFQAVTNLNAVRCWPMHEVTAPAPGDVETNLGTLGALANRYDADWMPNSPITTHQVPGALSAHTDTAAFFNGSADL